MRFPGWQTLGTPILAALIGVVLWVNVFTVFGDHDFFWHLKTGEWIWQNHSLPAEDPFAYTTPAHIAGRHLFTLTSYWISQLLSYLLYRGGGFPALVALRAVLAGLLLWVMFRQNRGDRLIFMSLLVLALVVLRLYPLERPQTFSFVCFAALFGLLSDFLKPAPERPKSRAHWFALPLLMIVWANLHGGFIAGQMLILAFLVLEGIKFLHPALGPLTREGYRRLLVAGLLGLAGSLCNPNTWHGLAFLATPTPADWQVNIEYLSTVFLVRSLNLYQMVVYWLLLLLALLGFIARRDKPDLTSTAILTGLGLVSFIQCRYVPFFLVVAVPGAALSLSRWKARQWFAAGLAGLALCVGLFFSWRDRTLLLDVGSGRWTDASMPAEQADFILANDLKGNMYNHWGWGGYLIWRLAPARKVFIDGRGLDQRAFQLASLIDNNIPFKDTGAPAWKRLFETYNILYVVVPFVTIDGERLPLADALLRDPEWLPCAENESAVIFVRDTVENSGVIQKYDLKNRKRVDGDLGLLNRWIESDPRCITPLLQKGELLMHSSRRAEARRTFEDALRIEPANALVRERLKELSTPGNPLLDGAHAVR